MQCRALGALSCQGRLPFHMLYFPPFPPRFAGRMMEADTLRADCGISIWSCTTVWEILICVCTSSVKVKRLSHSLFFSRSTIMINSVVVELATDDSATLTSWGSRRVYCIVIFDFVEYCSSLPYRNRPTTRSSVTPLPGISLNIFSPDLLAGMVGNV